MNVLIAGGSGFIGRALTRSLAADGHRVWILTRTDRAFPDAQTVLWDGRTVAGWGERVNEIDAIVNLAGKTLASWPWTPATKRLFRDSRVQPGRALAEAVLKADRPPRVFVQASGINHYGLSGAAADESTPPGDDFLARLTVDWEAASLAVEERGVRRVVTRSAVVLDRRGGMLPLMALPVRLFIGGPLAGGRHAMPWIHLADEIGAMRFLMQDQRARGPYNLIAPTSTSSAEFMRILAKRLNRPYWFPTPAFLLKLVLGGMSDLVAKGRFARPGRLTGLGYRFQFPGPEEALADLFSYRVLR